MHHGVTIGRSRSAGSFRNRVRSDFRNEPAAIPQANAPSPPPARSTAGGNLLLRQPPPVQSTKPGEKRRPKSIALTRKPGFNDGFGAQLQRVLAVYCICQEYGYDYVHTPLADIEYQGLQSLLEQKNSKAFVADCNHMLAWFLPSSAAVSPSSLHEKYEAIDADLPREQLEVLKQRLAARRAQATNGRSRALVRYQFPYVIADAHPEVYRHARGLFHQRLTTADETAERILVIGLHVRRGELFLVDSDRMLPNAFYLDMAGRVIAACKALQVPYVVELYSEVASRPTTVASFPGTGKQLEAPTTYRPDGPEALEDFSCLEPRLRRCLNEPLLTTFDRMIDCDILVMSRSSLSACAGYLKSSRGLVIYHPFWHEMLPASDGHIPCNDPSLDARCRDFVERFRDGRAGARRRPSPD